MSRLVVAIAAALAMCAFTGHAQADSSDYGIEAAEATVSTTQAGGHPDFTTMFVLKKEPGGEELPAPTRDVTFDLPPGLVGNPTVVSTCSIAQFALTDVDSASNTTGCPQNSQIGVAQVEVFRNGGPVTFLEPVYNIEPRSGEPARLGFFGASFPVLIGTRLRSEGDYGLTAVAEGTSSLVPLLSAKTEIWGVPADESHDIQRITPYEAIHHSGSPDTPNGKRSSGLPPMPFMLNPTRCGVAQVVKFTAVSYAQPDVRHEALAPLGENHGCGLLGFRPALGIVPSTAEAETGTGLDVELRFPTDGLRAPNLRADAVQRRVEVILPEGLTVNPSQAVGLEACTQEDYARESVDSTPGEGCPEASKIGSLSATSPLLEESAKGGLFVAEPYQNPFGTLIALYMVLKIPERGVIVKLPMKVEIDPVTGRLRSTVEEIPQLPVASFELHFREGARSPLVTPPHCGSYESTATFTSWAGHSVTTHPGFQISRGVRGAPCSSGVPPFGPGFTAGTLNSNAGSHSPFLMRFTRRDGDRELTRFSATLPPGVLAKLAGVSRCPDPAIDAAKVKAGKAERNSPSCPASSEIGSILAGAGVGEVLTYARGGLYLAGPYNGAPLSVAAIVPAVAGPFDVGTVVVRQALELNPRTGVVTADGSRSDPIPRILSGVPLKTRDVRINIDRPDFTLNPTSCDPFQTVAKLWGEGTPASVAARFQASNCANLGFRPRLSLTLRGGSNRSGHPALRGVLKPRPGDANLAGAVIRLPHSSFLDQAHIRTICTRVQFAANTCPRGAVYGHATATSPLLDEPLSGPVILRSSNHSLPDLVADLHGIVDVEAVARIDSVNGGIRASFTQVPDAPISKVVVSMQGARKGLIVNSTDLCQGEHHAKVRLEAHNGKRRTLRPAMRANCGASQRHSSQQRPRSSNARQIP
jgi:hypothetical protein